MEQRHLVLVDEQSQSSQLQKIAKNLQSEGIELIYREINPKDYVIRHSDVDVSFDQESFTNALKAIPFIHHLDVFATDYNLIEEQLKGINVLSIFSDIKPFYNKKVVIYSAQIEGVIQDILARENESFDEQISMLKLLTRYDVEYWKSEDGFGTKLKGLITKEQDISIDDQLTENMMDINSDKILFSIPPFDNMTLPEVAKIMISKDSRSIKLRKEITDHIMAIITKIDAYE